jgi:kynurenine formamidase
VARARRIDLKVIGEVEGSVSDVERLPSQPMPKKRVRESHPNLGVSTRLLRRTFMKSGLISMTTPFVAGSVCKELAGLSAPSLAQVQPRPAINTDDDVALIIKQVTNWEKWGRDDQLGTLNYITSDHRRRAAGLVRVGQSISLSRQFSISNTEGLREARHEVYRDESGSRDFVGMVFHGFAQTHLDALCHVFTPDGKMYNGYAAGEVATGGAKKLGIQIVAASGIIGRGVLLDVALSRGGPLAPGTPVFIADLERAERRQSVRVRSGDLLFIRTGAGIANTRERRSGLHPECLIWLHRREIALLGSDGDNDVFPLAGFERWASAMHSIAIPYMGLSLVDNAELDTLSKACVDAGRWEFFLTIAPWRFEGVTSSPVNPVALM